MNKVTTKVTKVYEVDGVRYNTAHEANVAVATAEIADVIGDAKVAKEFVNSLSNDVVRENVIKAIRLLVPKKPAAPRKKSAEKAAPVVVPANTKVATTAKAKAK